MHRPNDVLFESYFEKDADRKLHIWAAKLGSEIKDPDSKDHYTEEELEYMLKSLSSGSDGKAAYGFNHNSLTKMINIIKHRGGEAYWQPISSMSEFDSYFDAGLLKEMKSNGYKYMAVIGNWLDGEMTRNIQQTFPEEFQSKIINMTDYNNDLTFLFSSIPVSSELKQLLKPIGAFIDLAERYEEYKKGRRAEACSRGRTEKEERLSSGTGGMLHPDVIRKMQEAGYSEEEIEAKYRGRKVVGSSR